MESTLLAKKISRPFGLVEDWLAFFFANLLTIGIGMAVLMDGLNKKTWNGWTRNEKLFFSVVIVGWTLFDVPYLLRLWHSAFRKGRHPTFVTADTQRVWTLFFRPIVALWWLAHFAVGLFFVFTPNQPARGEPPLPPGMFFFMTTCCGFAANGYLILAIAALTRSAKVRRTIWRYRVLSDIAMGMAAWLLVRR